VAFVIRYSPLLASDSWVIRARRKDEGLLEIRVAINRVCADVHTQ
jgi:hypothetical protein